MLAISLELAKHRPVYEDIASKFFEHFMFVADAISFRSGESVEKSLWTDEDGFYYDAISHSGPWSHKLSVRSLVGLIPLYTTISLEPQFLKQFPSFNKRFKWFTDNRKGITKRFFDEELGTRSSKDRRHMRQKSVVSNSHMRRRTQTTGIKFGKSDDQKDEEEQPKYEGNKEDEQQPREEKKQEDAPEGKDAFATENTAPVKAEDVVDPKSKE